MGNDILVRVEGQEYVASILSFSLPLPATATGSALITNNRHIVAKVIRAPVSHLVCDDNKLAWLLTQVGAHRLDSSTQARTFVVRVDDDRYLWTGGQGFSSLLSGFRVQGSTWHC